MTLNEMLALAARILGDEEGERWNTDELTRILDQLHRQLLAEAGVACDEVMVLTPLTVAGQPDLSLYQASDRFLEWKENGVRIELGDNQTRLLYPRKLDEMGYNWANITGTPYWYIQGYAGDYKTLRVYPYPTDVAANITAYCKVSPKSLVELGSPSIPQAYHEGLVYAAVSEAYDSAGDTRDVQQADRWRAKAAAILTPYKQSAARGFDRTPITVKGHSF